MLRCSDGRYYVGHTDDLERRMAEHQQGTFEGWTSKRRPVELVWFADTSARDVAIEWELKVKPWSRRKKEALIRGDLAELRRAARGPNRQDRTDLGRTPGTPDA
jgi:putative endonuclease